MFISVFTFKNKDKIPDYYLSEVTDRFSNKKFYYFVYVL